MSLSPQGGKNKVFNEFIGIYEIGRISRGTVIARHEAICKYLTDNRLLRAYQ